MSESQVLDKHDDPLLTDSIGERISYWTGTFTIRDLQNDMPSVPARRIHSRIRTLVKKRAIETVSFVYQDNERVALYRMIPLEFRLPPSAEEYLRQKMGNLRYGP